MSKAASPPAAQIGLSCLRFDGALAQSDNDGADNDRDRRQGRAVGQAGGG